MSKCHYVCLIVILKCMKSHSVCRTLYEDAKQSVIMRTLNEILNGGKSRGASGEPARHLRNSPDGGGFTTLYLRAQHNSYDRLCAQFDASSPLKTSCPLVRYDVALFLSRGGRRE